VADQVPALAARRGAWTCGVGIAQMGIQLVFFLHITAGPDDINNVLAPAFGILIVTLVVAGSRRLADPISARRRPGPPNLSLTLLDVRLAPSRLEGKG
jgi:hypothetical protein